MNLFSNNRTELNFLSVETLNYLSCDIQLDICSKLLWRDSHCLNAVFIVSFSFTTSSSRKAREIRHFWEDSEDCQVNSEIEETALDEFCVYRSRNHIDEIVVVKDVWKHFHVTNKWDNFKCFQHRTSFLRSFLDEIEETSDSSIIVLKHLDDHLLNASIKKTLNRKELKYVAERILEALKMLHEDDYVHTHIVLVLILLDEMLLSSTMKMWSSIMFL